MAKVTNTFTKALKQKRKQFERELSRRLTASAIVVQAKAMEYTPIEYGALQNSQYREAVKGNSITIGYTADYAAALHERDDWSPRPVDQKDGPAWNPKAKPQFLTKALEEKRPEVMKTLSGALQL